MVRLLTGENSFKLHEYMSRIISEFSATYPDGIEKFEAENISNVDAVLDSVRSISFLSPKKLVIVEDYFQNKSLIGITQQLIDQCSDTTELYIIDTKPDKRTAEYKLLLKSIEHIEFKNYSQADLAKWVGSYAASVGAKIDSKTTEYLLSYVGEEQNLLKNNLDKLALYDKNISTNTIDLLCEQAPSSKIFSMLEALFAGHYKKALDYFHDQIAQGAELQMIMSMIVWQLQQITLVVFAGGDKKSTLIKSGVSPYSAQKLISLGSRISKEDLRNYVLRLAEIDAQSKTDSDLESAMTLYFSEVAIKA